MDRPNEQADFELIDLGGATADTQGAGGLVMEGSDYQFHTGMSD